ncbi:hypothetical protein BJ741DRAFT_588646 [Chytriomyces cf. hyalinus JEL632]|nr:hypothetical protein BJ741DRAFT_588646 [Chytriomyces cf. hyalinus JEL632]
MRKARQKKTHQTSILAFTQPGIRPIDSLNSTERSAADVQLQRALEMSMGETAREQEMILRQIQSQSSSSSSSTSAAVQQQIPIAKNTSWMAEFDRPRPENTKSSKLATIHRTQKLKQQPEKEANPFTADPFMAIPPHNYSTTIKRRASLQIDSLTRPNISSFHEKRKPVESESPKTPGTKEIVLVGETPPPTSESALTPRKQLASLDSDHTNQSQSSPEVLSNAPWKKTELRPLGLLRHSSAPVPLNPCRTPPPQSIPDSISNEFDINSIRYTSTLTSAKKSTPLRKRISYSFLDRDEDDSDDDAKLGTANFENLDAASLGAQSPVRRTPIAAVMTPRNNTKPSSLELASSPVIIVSTSRPNLGLKMNLLERGDNFRLSRSSSTREPVLISDDEDDKEFAGGNASNSKTSETFSLSKVPKEATCPMCSKLFLQAEIENHASYCFGDEDVQEAPSKATTRRNSSPSKLSKARFIHDTIVDNFDGYDQDGLDEDPFEGGENHDAEFDPFSDTDEPVARDDANPTQLSPLKGFVNLKDLEQQGQLGHLAGYFNQFSTKKKSPKKRRGGSTSASTQRGQASAERFQKGGRFGRGGRAKPQRGGRKRGGRSQPSQGGDRSAADASYNYYADEPDFTGVSGAGSLRWESGRSVHLQ